MDNKQLFSFSPNDIAFDEVSSIDEAKQKLATNDFPIRAFNKWIISGRRVGSNDADDNELCIKFNEADYEDHSYMMYIGIKNGLPVISLYDNRDFVASLNLSENGLLLNTEIASHNVRLSEDGYGGVDLCINAEMDNIETYQEHLLTKERTHISEAILSEMYMGDEVNDVLAKRKPKL